MRAWTPLPARFGAVLLVCLACAPLRAQDKGDSTPDDQAARDAHCAKLPEERRRQTEACKTDDERREDEYQKLLKERAEHEKPTHTSFLRWFHLDGPWIPTTTGVSSYGVIGTHVAVANVERVYLFGPPGVMLLLENDGGTRRFRPALTWGISVYVADVRLPGSTRPAQVYFSLTKAWTFGSFESGLDMVGMSLGWKKKT